GSHRPEIFYEEEMKIRRLADYPPWVRMVQIRVEHANLDRGREAASRLAHGLRASAGGSFKGLGPAPAPLARLQGRPRQQILLKGASRTAMAEAVRRVLAAERGALRGIGVIVEPDPRSLL